MQQERAHAFDRGVLASQTRLATLVAKEDYMQALGLVGSRHGQLAAEASLHAHPLEFENQLIPARDVCNIIRH